MTAHGVMFHSFHGVGHPVVPGSWSADDLARFIARERHRLLTAKDWLGRAQAGRLTPEDLVLTFDDGLRCQYYLARPVVEAAGLTAFWFVPTAPLIGIAERTQMVRWLRTVGYRTAADFYAAVGSLVARAGPPGHPAGYLADRPYLSPQDRDFRYWCDEVMTPDEYARIMDHLLGTTAFAAWAFLWLTPAHVRELQSAGHVLGIHGHTHPRRIDRLTREQQESEYVTSTSILERITGERPTTISHPCGRVSRHGLTLLHDLGYVCGFSAVPAANDEPLLRPRLNAATLARGAPG